MGCDAYQLRVDQGSAETPIHLAVSGLRSQVDWSVREGECGEIPLWSESPFGSMPAPPCPLTSRTLVQLCVGCDRLLVATVSLTMILPARSHGLQRGTGTEASSPNVPGYSIHPDSTPTHDRHYGRTQVPLCAASSQSMRAPEWEALILRLVCSGSYASPKYSSEASCPNSAHRAKTAIAAPKRLRVRYPAS